MNRNKRSGFTLVEMCIVLGILIAIASSTFLLVGKRLEKAAIDAEDTRLDAIVTDIRGSFESEDFEQVNIAAFSGSIPVGTDATAFSTATSGSYATTASNSWFAKVARYRGLSVTYGTAPDRQIQPELARIAYNDYGNPRILIAAPAETDRQRFLLISLMAPSDQLQLPSYDAGSAFFEGIFGTDWDTMINGLPSDWSSRLTATQLATWNASGYGSKLFKLRVRKITIQKHKLNITNSNSTETLIVTTDGGATVYTLSPSSTLVTPPIFEGRQVQAYLNSVSNPVQQNFTLRRRTDVTYQ